MTAGTKEPTYRSGKIWYVEIPARGVIAAGDAPSNQHIRRTS